MTSENKRPKKDITKKVVIAVAAVLAFVLAFVGGYFSHYIIDDGTTNTVGDVLRLIKDAAYIIDPVTGENREITAEELADALVGALNDPYSEYYTPEEYAATVAEGKGNTSGVGLGFYDDDAEVDIVMGNSPADTAAVPLKVGDVVCSGSCNGESSGTFQTATDVLEFLRSCPPYEPLTLNFMRGEEQLSTELIRRRFVRSYVCYYDSEDAYLFRSEGDAEDAKPEGKEIKGEGMKELPADTAYISFSLFQGNAANELKEAIGYMTKKGRTKLIFDLRNDGGGYMDILTQVASVLIYNGGASRFAVAIAGGKSGREVFYSGKNQFDQNIESIAVLANEHSASASECLIGAMIHYGGAFDRSRLVIEEGANGKQTTFGKGIMQTTYRLMSSGAVKLTTARIYWPDGTTTIHGKGISAEEGNVVKKGQAINRAITLLG